MQEPTQVEPLRRLMDDMVRDIVRKEAELLEKLAVDFLRETGADPRVVRLVRMESGGADFAWFEFFDDGMTRRMSSVLRRRLVTEPARFGVKYVWDFPKMKELEDARLVGVE